MSSTSCLDKPEAAGHAASVSTEGSVRPRAGGAPHLLTELQHRAQALGDRRLGELHAELRQYPGESADSVLPADAVVLPLR